MTDNLKPIFGLEKMNATRFFGSFEIKLVGKQDKTKPNKYEIINVEVLFHIQFSQNLMEKFWEK